MPTVSLLKVQIGPVQDFIAQARSTRDLWSGSYLLSWLMAAGIRALPKDGAELIFPNRDGQPLLKDKRAFSSADQKRLLTPNIPNLFVARIAEGDAVQVAKTVKKAIENEWRDIADSVWAKRHEIGLKDELKDRFDEQVARHLSISWMLTPLADDTKYLEAYGDNGWHLDAVRQTRDFAAWNSGSKDLGNDKDSLSGKEEAVVDCKQKVSTRFTHLFKHEDHLGAINLIKRVWHLTYLKDNPELNLKTASHEFNIRSTRGIATRDYSNKADDDTDLTEGEKYLAAIAFDGDSIGKWVNGDLLSATDKLDLTGHHQRFSTALSDFALNRVRDELNKHDAFLIYAGGDDVVALVPADAAIACAKDIRTAFRSATDATKADDGSKPDASAGIAIAHIKSPLQDLIREAQKAEKRAKNVLDRSAFSVTLMKRSGEISQWGAKWDCGGIALYEAISQAMNGGALSGKFPHRVCQLLEPYVTKQTGLSQMCDAADFNATDVIQREFAHAAERQGSKAVAKDLHDPLKTYLRSLDTAPQTQLTAVIGLCTTIAFAHRNRPTETHPADRQPAA